MLSNFFKDLFAPTQYVYVRAGGQLAISQIQPHPIETKKEIKQDTATTKLEATRQLQLHVVLDQLAHSGKNKLDEKENQFLDMLFNPNAKPALLSMLQDNSPSGHTLSQDEALRVKMMHSPLDMEHELEAEAQAIKNELTQAMQEEKQLEATHTATPQVHTHVTSLEQQLTDIMAQKQQLEQEILKLKQGAAQPHSDKPKKSPDEASAPQASQNVRVIPTSKASSLGLPSLSDVPNIVIGIIRDARGNVLPNILVEIKDKDDNPVRAFKTNGLGHFASATPLSNGIYTIIFEDPKGKHQFENVAIEAKGEIMLPFEIISRDAREDLRKELFA